MLSENTTTVINYPNITRWKQKRQCLKHRCSVDHQPRWSYLDYNDGIQRSLDLLELSCSSFSENKKKTAYFPLINSINQLSDNYGDWWSDTNLTIIFNAKLRLQINFITTTNNRFLMHFLLFFVLCFSKVISVKIKSIILFKATNKST